MTYANIELKRHKGVDAAGNTVEQDPVIFPFMKPFVEALALKYPQWKFVECDARRQWGTDRSTWYAADGFTIMDKREELGTIRIDHWCRTGTRYWVDNFRIDAQKSRGSGFKTKHLDKAVKHVSKYFGSRNTTELVEAAEEEAYQVKRGIMHNLQSEARHKWNLLDDYAADFLMKNWESFAEYMKPIAGAGLVEAVEKYPEAYHNLTEAQKINDMIEKGTAWLVHIVNSDYIVKQGETVSILDSEKLPNIVRRNLGMLKLVQNREIISNVGIRVDESTYYVLGENNE